MMIHFVRANFGQIAPKVEKTVKNNENIKIIGSCLKKYIYLMKKLFFFKEAENIDVNFHSIKYLCENRK